MGKLATSCIYCSLIFSSHFASRADCGRRALTIKTSVLILFSSLLDDFYIDLCQLKKERHPLGQPSYIDVSAFFLICFFLLFFADFSIKFCKPSNKHHV